MNFYLDPITGRLYREDLYVPSWCVLVQDVAIPVTSRFTDPLPPHVRGESAIRELMQARVKAGQFYDLNSLGVQAIGYVRLPNTHFYRIVPQTENLTTGHDVNFFDAPIPLPGIPPSVYYLPGSNIRYSNSHETYAPGAGSTGAVLSDFLRKVAFPPMNLDDARISKQAVGEVRRFQPEPGKNYEIRFIDMDSMRRALVSKHAKQFYLQEAIRNAPIPGGESMQFHSATHIVLHGSKPYVPVLNPDVVTTPTIPFVPADFRVGRPLGAMGLASGRHPAFETPTRPNPPPSYDPFVVSVDLKMDQTPQARDRLQRLKRAIRVTFLNGRPDDEAPFNEIRLEVSRRWSTGRDPRKVVFTDKLGRPGYKVELTVEVNADMPEEAMDARFRQALEEFVASEP